MVDAKQVVFTGYQCGKCERFYDLDIHHKAQEKAEKCCQPKAKEGK